MIDLGSVAALVTAVGVAGASLRVGNVWGENIKDRAEDRKLSASRIAVLETQVGELQASLLREARERSLAEDKLQKQVAMLDRDRAVMEREIASLREQVARLTKRLDERNAELAEVRRERDRLQKELEAHRK